MNFPALIGAGICDACGEHVEQLMVINQSGGRGATAIFGLCSCQNCAGSCWPNATMNNFPARNIPVPKSKLTKPVLDFGLRTPASAWVSVRGINLL